MKGMEICGRPIVYDIGYQFYDLVGFLARMWAEGVTVVVDVRSFPTSKKPGFAKKELRETLAGKQILYVWMGKELGGEAKPEQWDAAMAKVAKLAETEQVCLMCMENEAAKCHRRHLRTILNGFKVHTVSL